MTGVLDSGRGGEISMRYLYTFMPSEPCIIFTDRENAPYGKKTKDELIPILRRGLTRLTEQGADRILVACCTMCTVLPSLVSEFPNTFSIIEPTAREAVRQTRGKIAVISTERTEASHAFRDTLLGLCDGLSVTEIPAPDLVTIAEAGGPALPEEKRKIDEVLLRVTESGADTLILGCTHFSLLKEYIAGAVPDISLVDSARVGAFAYAADLYKSRKNKRRPEKWQNTEEEELTRRWQTSLP